MKRSTWVLVVVLVVLGIATIVVLQQPGEVSSTGSMSETLVDYDSLAVDKIEIRSSKGTVILEKEGGIWNLISPVKYRADETTVTTAIGKGRSLDLSSLVSTNPQKQELFKVDSLGTLVNVYEKGEERASFRIGKASSFRIGKTSSSFTETYVKREGSDDVYLAAGNLAPTFDRQVKDWRDKTIFKSFKDNITNVKFQYGDTTFLLTFQDSVWRVDGDSAVESKVSSFLGSLANFQTDEFVDSDLSKIPKPTGSVEVEGTQIRYHFNKDSDKYYVQTSRSSQWFEINSWKAKQILKRKKAFLPS
jgi:hypothetical protein